MRLLLDLTDDAARAYLPGRLEPTHQILADAIDRILISHIDSHRAEIEAKLRG